MTKFFKKEDGSQLEFSNQRYYAYKKLLVIWSDPKQSVQLTKIINSIRGEASSHLSSNSMSLVEKLDKLGLLNMYKKSSFGTNFWNSGTNYGFRVTDADFLNFVFFKENNSSLLRMAKLKTIEYRNGHSLGEIDYVSHGCCRLM